MERVGEEIHFMLLVPVCNTRKQQITEGFRVLSGIVEKNQWH